MSTKRDYDVIVVGGGGAGMCAAIMASDRGTRVAIVEADRKLGGSTALSGGVYYAAGTPVQQEAGINDDSADAMFEYYMTLNQYRVEASLARTLCDNATPGLEWLMALGVKFPSEDLYSSGVESVPRGHSASGMGVAIAASLDLAVSQRPIDVSCSSRVENLVTSEKGRVTGIQVGGDIITAGAVVLATGGFGANSHLLHKYYPDAAMHGNWTWYIGSTHCQGDGLTMGQRAGAEIIGDNRGLLLTTPNFSKNLEVYVPGWLVYINREGRRFVNETVEYAVMSGVIKSQTGGSCFAIFDHEALMAAKPDTRYADAFAAGTVSLNWVTEELQAQIRVGKVFEAETLEELGEKCGIRPRTLGNTVAIYNRDTDAGYDSMFFKQGAVMKPIRSAPYYAVEIRPAIVCLTSTGLRINNRTQVLDMTDKVIPGLFAAGETTGGVLGERYIGGGNSITNAIVFGRIAGVEAAIDATDNRHF